MMLILSNDVDDGDERNDPFEMIVESVFPPFALFDVPKESNETSDGNRGTRLTNRKTFQN